MSINLTEEQKRGIDKFVQWYRHGRQHGFGPRPIFRISGPAGSGKSTLAFYALEAAGLDPKSAKVLKLAYTGKAAMVMRQKGLPDAGTIHSAIYTPVENVDEQLEAMREQLVHMRGELGALRDDPAAYEAHKAKIAELEIEIKKVADNSKDEMSFVLNYLGVMAQAEFVLCDEASMVGGQVQHDLESFGVPILYLGDGFQLPPIDNEGGSVFFDEHGNALPVEFELTEIHRQAEGSAIIRHSRDIRLGLPGMNFDGRDTGDDGGVLIRVRMDRLRTEHLARADQVICGKNDTRHALNAQIREFLGRESAYPVEGDKLICLRNNKERRLVNGMMATATREYYSYNGKRASFLLDIEAEDGRSLVAVPSLVTYFQYPGDKDELRAVPWYLQKELAHFDYGNAITAHKSQGSQYMNAAIIEEPLGRGDIMRRRWRYTAVTRIVKNGVIGY